MSTPSIPSQPAIPPASTPPPNRRRWGSTARPTPERPRTIPKIAASDLYRAILWTVVAILAVVVWFASAPSDSVKDWSSDISAAEITKGVNDDMTSGAPQQQVVNGWFIADTIPVISEQLSAVQTATTAGRVPSLILLFGLGACADMVGRSVLRARERDTVEASSDPIGPGTSALASHMESAPGQSVPTLGA